MTTAMPEKTKAVAKAKTNQGGKSGFELRKSHSVVGAIWQIALRKRRAILKIAPLNLYQPPDYTRINLIKKTPKSANTLQIINCS
jgi:hypothetical protein